MALWINREYVEEKAFLEEFRQLGGLEIDSRHPAAEFEAAKLQRLAEQRVVSRTLLRQRATQHGITVTAGEIQAHRDALWGTSSASVCDAGVLHTIGESLMVQKYCDWLTRHEPRASRIELEALYQQRREQFHVKEQINLMQVVRNIYLPGDEEIALPAMQAAERDLDAGILFQKVADRYSDCGGKMSLGWIQRGEMVAAFEDVAFGLAKGRRSGIFRTVFGLHILMAVDTKPSGYRPFDEVRPLLAKELLHMRKQRRINAEVAEAMRSASIAPATSRTERRPSQNGTISHG